MVPLGLEPRTPWLWVRCSDQLSYRTWNRVRKYNDFFICASFWERKSDSSSKKHSFYTLYIHPLFPNISFTFCLILCHRERNGELSLIFTLHHCALCISSWTSCLTWDDSQELAHNHYYSGKVKDRFGNYYVCRTEFMPMSVSFHSYICRNSRRRFRQL